MYMALNSLRPSDKYIMLQWNKPSLAQTMACRLFDTKPLSGTMLLIINCTLRNKFQWNFKQSSNHFKKKSVWECHWQNGSHFLWSNMLISSVDWTTYVKMANLISKVPRRLTCWGLMMLYGVRDFSQHWFRSWLSMIAANHYLNQYWLVIVETNAADSR